MSSSTISTSTYATYTLTAGGYLDITATGAIPQDPAKNRAIFQFEDGPAIRGSTSTAVTTQ